MDKRTTFFKWAFITICLFPLQSLFAQSTIKVTVDSVQAVLYKDCDGFTLPIFGYVPGESDFVWEFTATDNTLGYSNNNAAGLFGILGFNYASVVANNGPFIFTSPNSVFYPSNGLFFEHFYVCPSDVPTNIRLDWEGYDDDGIGPYDLVGLRDGETGLITSNMAVPGTTGTVYYNFLGVSTDAGCAQTYKIYLKVERIDAPPTVVILPDEICNAITVNMNTDYSVAVCSSNTLETNEPAGGDVAANVSSAWFKFVAPASGAVEVSLDNTGTEIGTYIEIYHAADGGNCGNGLQPITGTELKDKFEYLSHVESSDGIDEILGVSVDPEAQISFSSCNPLPLISYQKLIAGETYYVQVAGDNNTDAGIVVVRVNDLGGSPAADTEDIPCLSANVAYTANEITYDGGNGPSTNLDYGCAYDGGANFGETGVAHTNSDPNNYHAYHYSSNDNSTTNETVWFNFTAPNSGRMYIEANISGFFEAEDLALYAFDPRFSPGVPTDLMCYNLVQTNAATGSDNGFTAVTPKINATCLEPGYKYYGMLDPQDLSISTNGDVWIYDPSVAHPEFNAPGNDILCIALADTLYEVPVVLAGTNPTFQAVAGSNVRACREFLAGEPASNANPLNRADQTVWHYFVAPPSGAVEMSIRAYIGMDTLRYSVYELLNGTDCYGGLNPATYTTDGTRNTPIITPIMSGTASYQGSQTSACCLTPGKIYAIQIDGGAEGDEGEYIIEYLKEVNSDAGDIFIDLANGTTIEITAPDTAFVCYGDVLTPGIMVNGIGESTADLPSCLTPGYVIHQTPVLPDPIANTGFTYIDSIQTVNGTYTNNGDGSGSFGNPLYNTLYYISPAGDITADWGDFTCGTSTVEAGLPVIFLRALNANLTYNNTNCTASFSATGGLNGYYNNPYSYTITNPSGTVVQSGTMAAGVIVNYTGALAGTYTVLINDGACPKTLTFSGCTNPCVATTNNVTAAICQGDSILLGGAMQTLGGVYTDVLVTAQGCDSTVITTLIVNSIINVTNNHTICQGNSIQVGTSSYNTQGVYVDTLQSIFGCDSIITSIVFVTPALVNNIQTTICSGSAYSFNGTTISSEGVYTATLVTSTGCDSIVKLTLFVSPPQYSFESQTICLGDSYNLGGQPLTQSGIYLDTIQTAAGCDSIVNLELSVKDCVGDFEISNIVTPNNDGQNDTWKVNDLTQISGCTVTVFNRWGQPVFETTNYQNDWGGTKNGEPLPDGVYFYAIKCSEKEYTGSMNLLRFKK